MTNTSNHTRCYDCGESAKIDGDDGNHYCQMCWNGEPSIVKEKVVYDYDDKGVLCKYTEEEGWVALEKHCVTCGYKDCEGCEKKKAPRKIVTATYSVASDFVVPEGVDLEGNDVDDWYVKWDTLHIYMKDGTYYEVSPCFSARDAEMKRPDEEELLDDEDFDEEEYDEKDYVKRSLHR